MLSYSHKLKIPDGDVNNFSTKQPNLSVILFFSAVHSFSQLFQLKKDCCRSPALSSKNS